MRLLSCLALASLCVTLGSAAFAQQQRLANGYPQAVQQQYIADCLRQTTQQSLPVSQQVAQNYCGCMFSYIQQRVPYQSYQQYDKMIRAGKGQQIDAQFRGLLQQGATGCIQQFVFSNGGQ